MHGSRVPVPTARTFDHAAARSSSKGLPFLPALMVLTAMLPQGLNIRPGGILLTTPRLVLLFSLPWVVGQLRRKFASGELRVTPCDVIVVAAAFWMFLSVSMTQGIDRAVVGSSVMSLEICGAYFLIRSTLGKPGDAAAVVRFLACVIAVDGLLSVLDVIYERPVLHGIADALTGYDQPWGPDYRHGRMRAYGMQEHMIAFGTCCAIGGLIAVTLMRGMKRILVLGGCVIGLATSDSSAPYAGFLLGCLCLVYNRVMARFSWRWLLLFAVSGGLVTALLTLHPAPFSWLIEHTTSTPQDGYYRLFIWSIVGPLVLANPLFGLGLESDWAARFGALNTIDSFWLCLAANFGIPGAILFASMLLSAAMRPIRQLRAMAATDIRLGTVLGIIIFLYVYIGITVHFWGTMWILMGVFSALRVNLGERPSARDEYFGARVAPVTGKLSDPND